MVARLRSFASFWYRFVVGDDWTLAAGCIIALAATYGLSRDGVPSWWVVPVAVLLLLSFSVWRASRRA